MLFPGKILGRSQIYTSKLNFVQREEKQEFGQKIECGGVGRMEVWGRRGEGEILVQKSCITEFLGTGP